MKRLIILLVLSLWGLCCAASNADAVADKFYKTNHKCIVFFEGGLAATGEFEANPITEKTAHKEIMRVRVRLNLNYRDNQGKKFYHYFFLEKLPSGEVKITTPQKHQKERMWASGTRRTVNKIFLSSNKIYFENFKALGR